MLSDTETAPGLLRPVRAPGHRSLLAPQFGAALAPGGEPVGITMAELTTNPKLAELALVVFEQLQQQMLGGTAKPFGESGPELDGEAAAYRARLEFWADLLEAFLEETLSELERLDADCGVT